MRFKNQLSLTALTAVLATLCAVSLAVAGPNADEIVKRSVANNDRNCQVAPQYTCRETDVVVKNGKKKVRSYEDMMVDGWPYQKLLAENGEPLSPAQAQAEQQKLDERSLTGSMSRQRKGSSI